MTRIHGKVGRDRRGGAGMFCFAKNAAVIAWKALAFCCWVFVLTCKAAILYYSRAFRTISLLRFLFFAAAPCGSVLVALPFRLIRFIDTLVLRTGTRFCSIRIRVCHVFSDKPVKCYKLFPVLLCTGVFDILSLKSSCVKHRLPFSSQTIFLLSSLMKGIPSTSVTVSGRR